ncbi:hypothetical protein BASA81_018266 [Batrachochytrium salamandrivorans]|nr:hypothetical protein BASA81_018266 [Batrachochytrium salamandrivorans]
MRVDTGIILSVLSSSVLAAVIPNYDSRGTLLARRTVDPDPMDLLWKRADEDQMQLVPFGSRAGSSNGEGSSSSSSGNSELDKDDEPPKSLSDAWNNARRTTRQGSDNKRIQNAGIELDKVIQGEGSDKFISDVRSFLRTAVQIARDSLRAYTKKVGKPFYLRIPNGKNKRALTRKMKKLQKAGKNAVLAYRKVVVGSINSILETPQDVISALEKIVRGALALFKTHRGLYTKGFGGLVTDARLKYNEEHVQKTQDFMSNMKPQHESVAAAYELIRKEITSRKIEFKANA